MTKRKSHALSIDTKFDDLELLQVRILSEVAQCRVSVCWGVVLFRDEEFP